MKKLFILLLLLSLVGCNPSAVESDMEMMKAELQTLREENQDLMKRLDEVEATVTSTHDDIEDMNQMISENKESIQENHKSPKGAMISEDYLKYMTTFAFDFINKSDNYRRFSGIIKSYDEEKNTIVVNTIEMVGEGEFDRIEELGIDTDQPMIEAAYMYEHEDGLVLQLEEYQNVYLLDYDNDLELYETSFSVFIEKNPESNVIFMFDLIDGEIFRITERFFN